MRAQRLSIIAGLVLAGTAACAPRPPFSVAVTDANDGRFASAQYYDSQGCTGNNVPPRLIWTTPPASARSLAVTVFDPDAQQGQGWWHWLVSDLPPETRELKPDAALPAGALSYANSFGQAGYGGPCPPVGETHHYVITLYALRDAHLNVPAGATPDAVKALLEADAITEAHTTLTAGR